MPELLGYITVGAQRRMVKKKIGKVRVTRPRLEITGHKYFELLDIVPGEQVAIVDMGNGSLSIRKAPPEVQAVAQVWQKHAICPDCGHEDEMGSIGHMCGKMRHLPGGDFKYCRGVMRLKE